MTRPALSQRPDGGVLMSGRTWRRIVVVAVAILSVVVAGEQSARSAPLAAPPVKLRVTPSASLFDVPLRILVSGLGAGDAATVRVTSTDVKRVAWSARATFRADRRGAIDPARVAPSAGTYTGLQAMGLVDSMSPARLDPNYFWGNAPQSFTFTVTAHGRRTASVTIQRSFASPGVTRIPESVANTGFFGDFWLPAPGSAKQPAVVEFGGSEGGLGGQLAGALLASHGYPTLDIAYFAEPGLPPTLSNIPLEYFARALTWLSTQPDVDPHHLYVIGGSRGSEAAMLLGVHYPNLVTGVIATVPSNTAGCYAGCVGATWTLDGQPLPSTRQFNQPAPSDNPAAVIPVEQIHGPLLLVCGGADKISFSCDYANAIRNRLDANHDAYPHQLLAYAHAGHGVGGLVPYEPGIGTSPNIAGRPISGDLSGTTLGANPLALADAWPRFLAFLANPSS